MPVNILIATPSLGTMHVDYVSSLVGTTSYLQHRGIKWATFFLNGAVTAEARNQATNIVLKNPLNFTHVMFIDSDMTFPREGVNQLLDTGKLLVGGVYAKRQLKRELLVRMDGLPNQKLARVNGVGTGFMLIHRQVLETVKAKHPCPFQYGEDVVKGELLSEDYVFCDRYRALGGEVWAMFDMGLGHLGLYEYK